jgi:poly(A) polymerase Pap1
MASIVPVNRTVIVTEAGRRASKDLDEYILRAGMYPPAEDDHQRRFALKELRKTIHSWIFRRYRSSALNAAEPQMVRLFPSGSYALSVHKPGADIDVCCVVPEFVKREDFYSLDAVPQGLASCLQQLPFITNLQVRPPRPKPLSRASFPAPPSALTLLR